MNIKELKIKLERQKEIFVKDVFLEAAIRLEYGADGTKCYLKHFGKKEMLVPVSNETAFSIRLSGEEITKIEYDRL